MFSIIILHASLIIVTLLSCYVILLILRNYLEFLEWNLVEIKLRGLWEEMMNAELFSHLWLFYLKPNITKILTSCHCTLIKLLEEFQDGDKHNFRNMKSRMTKISGWFLKLIWPLCEIMKAGGTQQTTWQPCNGFCLRYNTGLNGNSLKRVHPITEELQNQGFLMIISVPENFGFQLLVYLKITLLQKILCWEKENRNNYLW